MPKLVDLAGKKFGRLTAIKREGTAASGSAMWLCACSCGGTKSISSNSLNKGRSRSCGCYQLEGARSRGRETFTHGATRRGKITPEYYAYGGAKARCTRITHPKYKNYGGATPPVLFKFSSFEEFFAEVGPRPEPKLSLDRINPYGHYERGNVRWATQKTQQNNRRAHADKRKNSCQ